MRLLDSLRVDQAFRRDPEGLKMSTSSDRTESPVRPEVIRHARRQLGRIGRLERRIGGPLWLGRPKWGLVALRLSIQGFNSPFVPMSPSVGV